MTKPAPVYVRRADGRIERVCKHGTGHPAGAIVPWQAWMGVHGCCGCCKDHPPAITDRLWTREDGVAK